MPAKISSHPTNPVHDPRLPLRARGLWATLLSMAGTDMRVPSALDQLKEAELRDGQYAIRGALADLEACGYVRKIILRDDRGKLAGTTWELDPWPSRQGEATDLGAVA